MNLMFGFPLSLRIFSSKRKKKKKKFLFLILLASQRFQRNQLAQNLWTKTIIVSHKWNLILQSCREKNTFAWQRWPLGRDNRGLQKDHQNIPFQNFPYFMTWTSTVDRSVVSKLAGFYEANSYHKFSFKNLLKTRTVQVSRWILLDAYC